MVYTGVGSGMSSDRVRLPTSTHLFDLGLVTGTEMAADDHVLGRAPLGSLDEHGDTDRRAPTRLPPLTANRLWTAFWPPTDHARAVRSQATGLGIPLCSIGDDARWGGTGRDCAPDQHVQPRGMQRLSGSVRYGARGDHKSWSPTDQVGASGDGGLVHGGQRTTA